MAKRAIGSCFLVTFLCALVFASMGKEPEDNRAEEGKLVGTWEYANGDLPGNLRHIKHLTPTHFTWVTYDREEMAPVAAAGGTWSIRGGDYREQIEFATEGHKHLRGRDIPIAVRVEGDKWFLKSTPDTGFHVDDVWVRQKR